MNRILFPFSWKSGRYKVAGDNTSNGRTASVGVVTNTLQSDHCFKQKGINHNFKKFFFGIFLVSLLAVACENDLAEIEKVISTDEIQVEKAYDVEILYSDSAVVRVRVTSPVMNRYTERKEPHQEFSEGVLVEFLGPNREVTSWLTAKYAIRLENKDQVIVRDSVVWQSIEREKLETEELIWDERTKKLYTNKFVTIIRPDEIIYGYGFESDQDFKQARIKAIEGTLKVKDLNQEFRD